MPPIKSYVVTQERQVRIQTTNPITAVMLSEAIFNGEEVDSTEGHATSPVTITEIRCQEDW